MIKDIKYKTTLSTIIACNQNKSNNIKRRPNVNTLTLNFIDITN